MLIPCFYVWFKWSFFISFFDYKVKPEMQILVIDAYRKYKFLFLVHSKDDQPENQVLKSEANTGQAS